MNILILTNYFPPEIGAASQLFSELTESFTASGHRVSVVTGFPRYRMGGARQWGLFRREQLFGASVIRVASSPFDRGSPLLRGLDHLYVAVSMLLGALVARRHDIVLVYSPPLTLGLTAWVLARRWKARAVVNVQDLFPKYAVDAGVMRNKRVQVVFEALERFVYRHADALVVHSEGNRAHVLANGGNAQRVHVIANWADTDFVRPGPRDNDVRREWGVGDRFVVLYAGTMGYQQDLDTILDAAALLRNRTDIVFVLVGDGVRRTALEERARVMMLPNVVFGAIQPWDRFPLMMQAADAGAVMLIKGVTTPGVPSKLSTIMASGKPVVLSVPETSDATAIVHGTECGITVPAEDPRAFASAVEELVARPDVGLAMGKRGRAWAEKDFSRSSAVRRYLELFRSARPQ